MNRVKVSCVALLLVAFISFSIVQAQLVLAQETIHMVSKWGFGIASGLQLLVKLSNEPGRAAEYGMGAAGGAAGLLLGKVIGGAVGEAIGGEGLGALGAAGLGAAGGIGGAKYGAAIGGGVDRARRFLAQEKVLLAKASSQQSKLSEIHRQADFVDESLAAELRNIRQKLDNLSDLVVKLENAMVYNPLVAKTINDNKELMADKTIECIVGLDAISHSLDL